MTVSKKDVRVSGVTVASDRGMFCASNNNMWSLLKRHSSDLCAIPSPV